MGFEPTCPLTAGSVSSGTNIGTRARHGQGTASDQEDWDFAGADDAKMTIRATIRYLLKGATDGVRGDIVQQITTIVRHKPFIASAAAQE
jgi:hypothetical protein